MDVMHSFGKGKMAARRASWSASIWNSDDMADLYAALFRDEPSAPPPDLPYGQFRMFYLKVMLRRRARWLGIRRCLQPQHPPHDFPRPRPQGPCCTWHGVVSPFWGGFSDERHQSYSRSRARAALYQTAPQRRFGGADRNPKLICSDGFYCQNH